MQGGAPLAGSRGFAERSRLWWPSRCSRLRKDVLKSSSCGWYVMIALEVSALSPGRTARRFLRPAMHAHACEESDAVPTERDVCLMLAPEQLMVINLVVFPA